MPTPQENLARFQEIANRGLQDNLPADKRARFDEAMRRGMIKPAGGQPAQPAAIDTRTPEQVEQLQSERVASLPELGQGGILGGESKGLAAAVTPALLTTTNPRELGQMLTANFPNIGITETPEGELIANNNETGAKVIINKPGLSQLDIVQGLGIAAAFTPAGRAATTTGLVGRTAATSVVNEAVQELSGGEFNAEQVAMDAVTAGLIDKAFIVAKSTGRTIADVLRKDVGVDPDVVLKSFKPREFRSTFSKAPEKPSIGPTLEQVSQPGLTPEAVQRMRAAEAQGVQLTKAQALQDFGAAEAEQTLLKSTTGEGAKARAFAEEQQKQLMDAAEAFTNRFGGSSRFKQAAGELADVTARDKGASIQSALRATQDLGRQEVSALYKEAAETAGEAIPLNNESLVNIADEIIVNRPASAEVKNVINSTLAKFGLIGDSVEQVSRNKFRVMEGDEAITIIGEQTPLTLANAEEFRKALNVAVGADTTGSAKLLIGELDNQVLRVIEQGAEIGRTSAFKTARQAAAEQKRLFSAKDVVQDLVDFKKGTKTPKVDPETVIAKIAKSQGAVTNLKKMKEVLLKNPTEQTRRAWNSIQAETVGDILGQAINKDTLEISGARLNSALKKYNPEALKELLGKKGLSDLRALQSVIGDATIPPPGTTNPSGTFLRFMNMSEKLGNFAGAGQINFGSLAMSAIKKGEEVAARKKTLDGMVNSKIKQITESNPALAKNRTALNKAAQIMALLEIRELDKEGIK